MARALRGNRTLWLVHCKGPCGRSAQPEFHQTIVPYLQASWSRLVLPPDNAPVPSCLACLLVFCSPCCCTFAGTRYLPSPALAIQIFDWKCCSRNANHVSISLSSSFKKDSREACAREWSPDRHCQAPGRASVSVVAPSQRQRSPIQRFPPVPTRRTLSPLGQPVLQSPRLGRQNWKGPHGSRAPFADKSHLAHINASLHRCGGTFSACGCLGILVEPSSIAYLIQFPHG